MNYSCNPVLIMVHLASLYDGREDASVFYFALCLTPFSPSHGFCYNVYLNVFILLQSLRGTFIISLGDC